MSDQPKKQELPPLDVTIEDRRFGDDAEYHKRVCRERQLLAALSDNEAKDARIAELEKHSDELPACYAIYMQTRAQLEAAEAKLKSVEGLLEDNLLKAHESKPLHWHSTEQMYYAKIVDALLARIREAVKGDK